MHLLSTHEVTKDYGNYRALNKVSIAVPQGSIYGLLGPNGAGKTSLIRIITQITAADSGEVLFNGQSLAPNHIYRIGYLPEERGLYKKMEVGEQLLYFAQLKGMSRKDAMDKLKHWVEKFEIRSWWNKKVEELSKGMQQKIQFIATVLHEPDLLILDEPFTGFDPINAALITDEIKRLKSNGCTIIFSTHRMESVEQLCDDIALINKSEKILEGAVKDIRSMHRSETYILEYEGALWKDSQFAEIAYEQLEENRHQHVFKLTSASAVNQLLQTVLQQPLRIVRFEEKLLTMQEVFVTHVQASAS